MEWHKTKPTKPGYYWMRNNKTGNEGHVIKVTEDHKYGPVVMFKPEKRWIWFMPVADMPKACEWAGPVDFPVEEGSSVPVEDYPRTGSTWTHNISGMTYTVTSLSNLMAQPDRADHPAWVEYVDSNGIKWSTSVDKFLSRRTLKKESNNAA